MLARPAGEPLVLRRLVGAGLLLMLFGFATAAGTWHWIYHRHPQAWDRGCHCALQLKTQTDKQGQNTLRLNEAWTRLKYFQSALIDPRSPLFATAREQIQKEKEMIAKFENIAGDLMIEPLRHFSITLFALLIPTVGLSMAAGHLMLKHANQANIWHTGETVNDWRLPYWLFVSALFVVNEAREFKTSIWDIDKSWYGWSSFCVCPPAWVLLGVMSFGVFMVIAYPATVIWCSVRTERRPGRLDPSAGDGAWGVGNYVLFLQTWSIVILLFIMFPSLIWLRIMATSSRFSLEYLATGLTIFGLALVVEIRLIWNAVQIRLLYLTKLSALASVPSSPQTNAPPGDPTKLFLGEQWWSFPVTVFGTLAVFWTIVQWTGVDTVLKSYISSGH